MREAGKELDAVRKDALAMAQNEATPTSREVATLAEKTHKPLDTLASAVADLKKESETLRKDLPEVKKDVDKWAVTGPAILTGVLVWLALGQIAIIAWGRRCLAPPPVAQAPPPPTIRK
jgi:hypothetical protein